MTDPQTDLRDRIAAERSERYAMAIHDAMEPDLSLVDQEPGAQALFARAAEAATALADSEQVELRRKLVAAERIRENADFHLGQEMARRQLAEKETARLRADRAAVLNAVAQHLYTALFPAVYNDLGQKAAEGVNRAATELRRLAAEAPDAAAQWACPTCGPVRTEPHPRLPHTTRCSNCKEHVAADRAAEAQQQPEARVPCSWVAVRSSHSPHEWKPQPGMTSVRCPGYEQPAVADTGEETEA